MHSKKSCHKNSTFKVLNRNSTFMFKMVPLSTFKVDQKVKIDTKKGATKDQHPNGVNVHLIFTNKGANGFLKGAIFVTLFYTPKGRQSHLFFLVCMFDMDVTKEFTTSAAMNIRSY